MKRSLTLLLLIAQFLTPAFAAALSPSDKAAISTSIDKTKAAFQSRDANAVANLTFENAIEASGGREQYIASITTGFMKLDSLGYRLISYTAYLPDGATEAGSYIVCIVSEVTDFELQGRRGRTTGYTLAVRKKSGGPWKLIGGDGVSKNPGALHTLLPGWPNTFQLPEYSTRRLESASSSAIETRKRPISPMPTAISVPPADVLVQQIVAGRSFPIKVDDLSQLDSVHGQGDTLTYNYTIFKQLEPSERQKLARSLRSGYIGNACSSANFRTLMKGGYRIRLNYALGNDADDVHVLVKPSDCKQ